MKLLSFLFLLQATRDALASGLRRLEDFEYNQASSNSSGSTGSSDPWNFFADTQSSYYDGYQQAWRYLGHLVKCGYPSDRYDEEDSHSQHSSDGDGRYSGNNYCQRYLLWAAVSSTFRGVIGLRTMCRYHDLTYLLFCSMLTSTIKAVELASITTTTLPVPVGITRHVKRTATDDALRWIVTCPILLRGL